MKKTILIILDGWGIGNKSKSDAISNAKTPYIDNLMKNYPNSQLLTSGENVGLPDGIMGNSEVGHMNIGSGRVIFQDLVRINKDVKSGKIANNKALVEAFEYAKKNNKAVHFLGLVSDGGVHSMNTHLYKMCDLTQEHGLKKVFIHALTDGRDTDPKSGIGFISELLDHIDGSNVKIASITGRYYTMDRDKRWDRIKIGYDAMVNGIGHKTTELVSSMNASYSFDVTDEFIKPIINIDQNFEPVGKIKEGDVIIAINYRTDRLRQITMALTQQNFEDFGMKTIPLHYVTMTRYDDKFKGLHIAYDKPNIDNTLGEVIANKGLKQLRIAETEKYAHVTFFFSGGRELPYENEDRGLVNSPKVATYDLQPEMSALKVKNKVVEALNSNKYDFICLNFANGDMVGHTGIYEAILKALNTVDICVEEVVETAKKNNYAAMIIADHGNADFVLNDDGSPNTQHSLNPVPCILIDDDRKDIKLKNGILADVAPTICKIMGIEKPKEMTGKELFL